MNEILTKAKNEADLYEKENLFQTPEEKKGFEHGFSTGYYASLTDIRNGLVDLDMIQRLLDDGRRNK